MAVRLVPSAEITMKPPVTTVAATLEQHRLINEYDDHEATQFPHRWRRDGCDLCHCVTGGLRNWERTCTG
jgi:hypothetical protein